MPLNPMTGQMEYGNASYDPQNMTAGMAMRGMAKGDVDVPLLFQLTESIPGISTTAAVNSRRYANTLFKGGFADVAAGTTGRKLNRAKKLGAFVGDTTAVPAGSSGMFLGGNSPYNFMQNFAKKRAARANATPFVRQSLNTNFRPKAFNRLSSLTSLTGDKSLGFYTPFQSLSGAVGYLADKSPSVRNLFKLNQGDKAYSGGVLGRIESINRISNLESTIARGAGSGSGFFGRRQAAKYGKAVTQRTQLVNNIAKVQSLANPSLATTAPARVVGSTMPGVRAALGSSAPVGMRGSVATRLAAARSAASVEAARNMTNVTLNPMKAVASTMTTGKISNAITNFYAGVVDTGNMSRAQKALTARVSRSLGGKANYLQFMDDFAAGGKYTGNFMARTAGGGKMIGMATEYLFKGGSKTVAAKFAGMGALRAAGGLMTPLNILATGQLIYDIGKGIGKIANAGQNFAKDALKSMQGTIDKPMFGAGFKDNEVAATSRSRGVMAIQNSRLNARSLLGSEASMMAAHFG
jgi:hypothetical protein